MNARVRRPGSSAADTASATARRVSRSGVLQAAQGDIQRDLLVVDGDPQRGHQLAEQPRPGALGRRSTSRPGSSPRALRAGAGGSGGRCAGSGRRSSAPSSASSSSARSSGSAAHSSSKNSSLVSISVARSWTSCSSAPRAGSAVSVANRSEANEPALPTSSLISASSCMAAASPAASSSASLPAWALANAVARCSASSSCRGDAVVLVAVDQRAQIPGGLEQLRVGEVVGGGRHFGESSLAACDLAILRSRGRRLGSARAMGAAPRHQCRRPGRCACWPPAARSPCRASTPCPRSDAGQLVPAIPELRRFPGCRPRTCWRCPGRRSRLDQALGLAAPRGHGGRRRRGRGDHHRHRHAGGAGDAVRADLRRRGADRPHRRQPPGQPAGADGPANLLDAVALAAAARRRRTGRGGRVRRRDPRRRPAVRKVDSTGPSAFGSPVAGPLGRVVEGRVWLHARPLRRARAPARHARRTASRS